MIHDISIRTVDQGDDESGEWILQRRGRITASRFGEIVKRKAAHAPLVKRILYTTPRTTKAMQYGLNNEPLARQLYQKHLCKHRHPLASVTKTGFHIDLKVQLHKIGTLF